MSSRNNFRLDSLILIPYWLVLFTIPAALVFTLMFLVGYVPTSSTEFFLMTILSAVVSYFLIKRYPVTAFKVMIGIAALFTVYVAFGAAVIGYHSSGLLVGLLAAAATIAVSYAVHKYAFARTEGNTVYLFL